VSPAILLCSAAFSWTYNELAIAFLYVLDDDHQMPPPHTESQYWAMWSASTRAVDRYRLSPVRS